MGRRQPVRRPVQGPAHRTSLPRPPPAEGQAHLGTQATALGPPPATYQQIFMLEGILFGIMGAALGCVWVGTGRAVRAVATPLREALDARLGRSARHVLLGAVGESPTCCCGCPAAAGAAR